MEGFQSISTIGWEESDFLLHPKDKAHKVHAERSGNCADGRESGMLILEAVVLVSVALEECH